MNEILYQDGKERMSHIVSDRFQGLQSRTDMEVQYGMTGALRTRKEKQFIKFSDILRVRHVFIDVRITPRQCVLEQGLCMASPPPQYL